MFILQIWNALIANVGGLYWIKNNVQCVECINAKTIKCV